MKPYSYEWNELKRGDKVLAPDGDYLVCRVRENDVVCTNGVVTRIIPDLVFEYGDVLIARNYE